MPVSKSTRPTKATQQMNGFYVHSSPPKVLQVHSSVIRQWLRGGDFQQLEQLVLEGQGHKLVGEYSPDPKVRAFLKLIPSFLMKTKRLHDAIAKGDLKQIQKILNGAKAQESPVKNIHASKSQGGLGLLHRAAYYGHPNVVEFLVSHYPESVKMRDDEGKTPLFYCGASKEAGKIWQMLMKAGADATATDSKGRRPTYYMERSNEIQLPEEKIFSGISVASATDKTSVVIKPSNIRIWIHDRDLKKLQKVIWEGHGGKLRVETSKHPKVKRFLEGIPYILNIIKDVHSSVVNDDFEEFEKKTSDPVPTEVLGSKDANGLTPLHKAAGLNRKKIAENILKKSPDLVFSVDREGKTPLHYAAGLREQSATYDLLTDNYADETAVDKNGKTPPHYRSNPKELNWKLLEVIPEAPRTAATFPQMFDWSLFRSDDVASANGAFPMENSPGKTTEQKTGDEKREAEEVRERESEEPEEKSVVEESENGAAEEEQEVIEEPGENKDFDIWTNDDEGEGRLDASSHESDGGGVLNDGEVYSKEEESNPGKGEEEEMSKDEPEEKGEEEKQRSEQKREEEERKSEQKREEEKQNLEQKREEKEVNVKGDSEEKLNEKETREKTEREIAEERQRLLDEGLLKTHTEEETEEEGQEDNRVNEAIEAGDMEKLAAMVLEGEGEKMRGKRSNNPEVQSFLDNVPTYMAKISAVHEAARNGSLKDLQAALDRRKFAIAKESYDRLGATPLHVAVIFENSSIIKYLGGRFPETLTSKDKFGRTPLHFSATLQDDGQVYGSLMNLGANPNVVDDEGHTATFYLNNPGRLTREGLIEEMNLPNDHSNARGVSSPVTDPSIRNVEPEVSFDEGIPLSKGAGNEDEDGDVNDDGRQSNFNLTDRDEYGQSVLHFAAARAHGRGGLFQLIHESGVNLGHRDELYRTARDIAQQANIPENVNEIDRYVISLAAKGETGKLMELFLEGYDHILDLEDDEDNDIVTVATKKNQEKALAFLKAIPALEEKRERIHRAVQTGDCKLVQDIIAESKNGRILIMGKSSSGRCSLHVAVLAQHKDITEFLAQKFPETLKIGDNLERTPLHYAMGVEEVEALSKILIKCGAKRVVKDLKGRQPTYYFMNRTDILKLQEEENVLRA